MRFKQVLTFAPELKLLGLGLRVDRVLLFGAFHSGIDVVRSDTALVLVCIPLKDLDILLNVASVSILSVVVLESGSSSLEQGFLGAKSRINIVLGTGRYFFAKLAQPEWAMVRDLLFGEHAGLVERIIQTEGGRLCSACCEI